MRLKDFWAATYRDISLVVEGYNQAEDRKVRDSWLQARMIAYYSLAAMNGTKKLGSIQSFMPLPWDGKAPDRDDVKYEGDAQKAIMERLKLNLKLQKEKNESQNIRKKK